MAKTQVNEAKIGQTIKVAQKVQSDDSVITIAAHTKSAATAVITGIETAGRYIFLDTTAGQIMMGAAGKVTTI